MVEQRVLIPLAQVRFLYPLPYKNILDALLAVSKNTKCHCIVSVFLYGRWSLLKMGTQNIRSLKVQILVKHSAE